MSRCRPTRRRRRRRGDAAAATGPSRVTCAELPGRAALQAGGTTAGGKTSDGPAKLSRRRGERLVLREGEVRGQSCELSELRECTVLVLDWSAQVTLDDCHDCQVLIGPVDGSLFVRNSSKLRVTAACRQLRLRDCVDCTLSLFAHSAAIEACDRIVFGAWNGAYAGLSAHFAAAKLEPGGRNRYDRVHDFNADDDAKAAAPRAPRWSLQPEGAWALWEVADAGAAVENPVPRTDSFATAAAAARPATAPAAVPAVDIDRDLAHKAVAEGGGGRRLRAAGVNAAPECGRRGGGVRSPRRRRAGRLAPAPRHRADGRRRVGRRPGPRAGTRAPPPPTPPDLVVDEIAELEELIDYEDDFDGDDDDDEDEVRRPPTKPGPLSPPPAAVAAAPRRAAPAGGTSVRAEALSADEVGRLHTLIFGDAAADWSPAWRRQGFDWSTEAAVPYGLHQNHGGPCGVLAAVQALLLRRLLAVDAALAPSADDRHDALLHAIGDVLTTVGDGGGCTVVLCADATLPPRRRLAAALRTYSLPSEAAARALVGEHAAAFTSADGCGVALLVYSVALTRGLAAAASDMDAGTGTLLGAHGYCTQELVNLLLTGQAHSNLFDGERALDGTALRGVGRPPAVGLLALAEAHGHCEVGSRYKSPPAPVWVVCMESHYSVVFAAAGAPPADGGAFELHFYDELANQDETIRLTVRPNELAAPPDDDLGLIPPLEETLRTRWPNAAISWDTSEPLL